MGMRGRIGRPGKAVLLVAAGLAGGGAAWAVASVPDSNGVIHACYPVTVNGTVTLPEPYTSSTQYPPYLRVIDPAAGQTCNTIAPSPGSLGPPQENTVNFNQQGPRGLPGAPGHAVTIDRTVTINRGGITVTLPPTLPQGTAVGGLVVHNGTQVLRSSILSLTVAPRDTATGQASGKRQHKPFVIVKEVDSATPVLFQAANTGQSFSRVTLFLTLHIPGAPPSYTVWHLTGVTVTGDHVSRSDTNELELIELTFAKIQIDHRSNAPPDDWPAPK